MSTVRVFPSPNLTPPAAFFAPKYALTPATVQVPGPAVAPLRGVVMPSVTAVSVIPGLGAPLAASPLRPALSPPPQPVSASARADATATPSALRDRTCLIMGVLASLSQVPPPRCPTRWSTTEWSVGRRDRARCGNAAVRGSARVGATRGRRG